MDKQELIKNLEQLQSDLEGKAEVCQELLYDADSGTPRASQLRGKRVAYNHAAELIAQLINDAKADEP